MARFGSIPLALLVAQCAAPGPGESHGEPARSARVPTYQGLTLEEWQEIPWSGKGRFDGGTGNITLERDVLRTVEPLRAFAGDSVEALARLRGLATDLDEDVREEACAALADLSFAPEANQARALATLMELVDAPDARVSANAMEQVLGQLDDEDEAAHWSRFGADLEERLAARVEVLLFSPRDEALESALAAIDVLGRRSTVHEQRFRALLAQPAARFRAEDAADELEDFARDRVDPHADPARQEQLALLAAERALELAPGDARCLDTLALARWRLGRRDEALDAARRAVEAAAAQELDSRQRERILDHMEMLSSAASWHAPQGPR